MHNGMRSHRSLRWGTDVVQNRFGSYRLLSRLIIPLSSTMGRGFVFVLLGNFTLFGLRVGCTITMIVFELRPQGSAALDVCTLLARHSLFS